MPPRKGPAQQPGVKIRPPSESSVRLTGQFVRYALTEVRHAAIGIAVDRRVLLTKTLVNVRQRLPRKTVIATDERRQLRTRPHA